jgi:hypothetical protein
VSDFGASPGSSVENQIKQLRRSVEKLELGEQDGDRRREIEHELDVFVREIQSDTPAVAEARAAADVLIVAAAGHPELAEDVRTRVTDLLSLLDQSTAADEAASSASEEAAGASPSTGRGAEGVGPPIYDPDED